MAGPDRRPDGRSSSFSIIQRSAQCIFARDSRLEHAPVHDSRDARRAGASVARQLRDFVSRVERDRLDGLVIELIGARWGASIGAAARSTRLVLEGILEADGAPPGAALHGVDQPHWWLRTCGVRWFVLTFAPCYGPESTRFTEGLPSTFVLLQPVSAFDRHAVPPGSTIPEAVRQAIRQRYARADRPYDVALAAQEVESLKFVWPLRHGDPPVRWWRS